MDRENYKILIIEDNPQQAHLMEIILHRDSRSYHVEISHNPLEALELLKKDSYDAVVLDYSLPKLNGLETLEEMRKNDIHVPVIMVTGQGDEMIAVEAMRKGVYDYLVKTRDHLNTLPRIIIRAIEEKRLSSQLEQSEQRYFALFDNASGAILIAATEPFQLIQVNKMAVHITGMAVEELVGKKILDLCSGQSLDNFKNGILEIVKEGSATIENVWFERKNAKPFPTDISASVFTIGNKRIVQLFVRDISEKIRMQRQLLLSRQRLVSVFDGITDLISVQDESYKLIMANKKYSLFTDKKMAQLVGGKCHKVLFGKESPCNGCPAPITYKSGKSPLRELDHEGKVFHITIFPMAGLDGHPEFIVEYIKDVTEQKDFEKQLIKADKLATIGILSSGIAHELRNPLNIIETARYSIEDALQHKYPEIDTKLKIIKKNIQRSSGIINNLLHFSRHSDADKEKIKIERLIDTTTRLVEKEINLRGVMIERNYDKVPDVYFSSDSLKQVFLNIILNAVQAMQNGGKLKITTRLLDNKQWVVASFEDTGVGIAKDNLPHIFTPFFTTKPAGEGTGLGLYLSYAILKREGGDIIVKSKEGIGTTFMVKLPVAGQE